MFYTRESLDYSLFHYIVEVDTPKRAWNILKEVFSEERVVEEDDIARHTKYQESHSEVEDSQEDCVYATTNVDRVIFDSENKIVNVAVLSDVSGSLYEQRQLIAA